MSSFPQNEIRSAYPSTQANTPKTGQQTPNPQLLLERLELIEGILHWRETPLDPSLPEELQPRLQEKPLAGSPTTSGPYIKWLGTHQATSRITWAVAYGRYPRFSLKHKPTSDGANNNINNFVEVVPRSANVANPTVEYTLSSGLVTVWVIPKASSALSVSQREVHQRTFSSYNEAAAWAEPILQQLKATKSNQYTPYNVRQSQPTRPSMSPTRVKRFPSLPELKEDACNPANSIALASLQQGATPLPAFDPLHLDMLSYRACERFVGLAVNFSVENQGYLPGMPKALGAGLTVTLGAVDGVWRVCVDAVTVDQEPIQRVTTSQEAALAPYSVSAVVRVGRSPGKAPGELRRALLTAYRATLPAVSARREAFALLTPALIPKLGQDLRKRVAPTRLLPDLIPCMIPIPLFLSGLFGNIDPTRYTPSKHIGVNQNGLLLVVERTLYGFMLRLVGCSRDDQDATSPTTVAQKLYPARVRQSTFDAIRSKAVYRGIFTSTESITKLSPIIAEAMTNRVAKEKGLSLQRAPGELQSPVIPGKRGPKPKEYKTTGKWGSFRVSIDGEEISLSEAVNRYRVVEYHTARARIKSGRWTAKAAVSTPSTKDPAYLEALHKGKLTG